MELTPSRWKGNTANESNNLRMNNPDLKRVVSYEKKKPILKISCLNRSREFESISRNKEDF